MHLCYYPSGPCWVCPWCFANHYKLVKAAGWNTSPSKVPSQKIQHTLSITHMQEFTWGFLHIDPNLAASCLQTEDAADYGHLEFLFPPVHFLNLLI